MSSYLLWLESTHWGLMCQLAWALVPPLYNSPGRLTHGLRLQTAISVSGMFHKHSMRKGRTRGKERNRGNISWLHEDPTQLKWHYKMHGPNLGKQLKPLGLQSHWNASWFWLSNTGTGFIFCEKREAQPKNEDSGGLWRCVCMCVSAWKLFFHLFFCGFLEPAEAHFSLGTSSWWPSSSC